MTIVTHLKTTPTSIDWVFCIPSAGASFEILPQSICEAQFLCTTRDTKLQGSKFGVDLNNNIVNVLS